MKIFKKIFIVVSLLMITLLATNIFYIKFYCGRNIIRFDNIFTGKCSDFLLLDLR